MNKYTIKSYTSVSSDTIRKRAEINRHKKGVVKQRLVLRRRLLGFILEHRTDIKLVCANYGVKRVWVIGSVAEGNDTNMSDVDFWVSAFDPRFHLSLVFELGQLLGYPVDVFYEGIEGLNFNEYVAPFGHVEL